VYRLDVNASYCFPFLHCLDARDVLMLLLLHPFNGLFFRTTWVSRHQKGIGKPFWILLEQDVVAVVSAGPYANHLHLAPDRKPCQYLTT